MEGGQEQDGETKHNKVKATGKEDNKEENLSDLIDSIIDSFTKVGGGKQSD